MKKKLSLLLSIIMMLSLFTGCAEDPNDDNKDSGFGPLANTSESSSSTSEPSSTPATSAGLTLVVSTRNPLLPTPDPETSDMDTFSPSDDRFPNINDFEITRDDWAKAFYDEYLGQRIRLVYVFLDGPYQDNTTDNYYMLRGEWAFQIDADTVETICAFKENFGSDGIEYVVDGIVTEVEGNINNDGCMVLLTNCNVEVAMGVPWWKDQHYGDNPYGDGDYGCDDGNDLNGWDTTWLDPVEADNNFRRFLESHYEGEYVAINGYLTDIGEHSATLTTWYKIPNDPYGFGSFIISTIRYTDVYSSNVINVNEGQDLTVYGYFDYEDSSYYDRIYLYECYVIPTSN